MGTIVQPELSAELRDATERRRLHVEIRGAVQGVGFRPFVYRLATALRLDGWVENDPAGVSLEIEGSENRVTEFLGRLESELPPRASIHELRDHWLTPDNRRGFAIRSSVSAGARTAVVLPDLAMCDECLSEMLDPSDRRYGYAFTNCTNCGPRYSIIRALPYDRPNTTMAGFTMCERCAAEYENPLDRRFHAQPNACPDCGPRLALWDAAGSVIPTDSPSAIVAAAVSALERGEIVAVKGIGGFHLMVDARNDRAVERLRFRKQRRSKPLAVMVADLGAAESLCVVSEEEAALLRGAEAPIVLLERRGDAGEAVAPSVAPGTRRLGVMLAYAPLHHLLLRSAGFPVVATSGNLSEEPICIDEADALVRLGGIADLFVVHDRPIERHVDDSIAWIVRGAPQVVRRARGFAPLPVRLPSDVPPLLAVGGHQKNTLAVAVGRQAFVSQHIGDLDAAVSLDAFDRVARDLTRLYRVTPAAIAHDMHPGYASTAWAQRDECWPPEIPRFAVQHHHAHLASCLADNGVSGPALGIIWDGSGYGGTHGFPDGTVWGGEFLVGDASAFARVAHLEPFRLPGGEAAVREPRRVAFSLLWQLFDESVLERAELPCIRAFSTSERRMLSSMLRSGVRAPVTTSAGRLFDGVASLLGLCQRSQYEGEAAMLLEQAADPAEPSAYFLPLRVSCQADGPSVLDWRALLFDMLGDLRRKVGVPVIAARFHNALVAAMVAVARHAGEERVALSGGCFQNRILVERGAAALERAGFEVLTHRQVPPNDGGISLGQIAIAAARLHHQP